MQLTPLFRKARVLREDVPCLGGVRVVFVSDIHRSRMFTRAGLLSLCAQIRALRPDLLLIGGDLGESEAYIRESLTCLGEIPAPLGRFGVLGNNDAFFSTDLSRLQAQAEELGVRLLRNEGARTGRIALWGADEMRYGHPRSEDFFTPRDETRILLSHYPQAVPSLLDGMRVKPQLALSGHTHAGQLRLGRLDPYSVGFERDLGPVPKVWGKCRVGDTVLYVSGGIGTSRVPLRVGTPAEMYLFGQE